MKFRRFQAEDYKRVEDPEDLNGRALVAWSPGLGKTIFALKYAVDHAERATVVICPASIKEHWRREAQLHFGRPAQILESRKPRKLKKGRHIYIINPDVLGLPTADKLTWTEVLHNLNPDTVIADEVHWYKSHTAKRSRAVKYICQHADNLLFLSGTPLVSRPMELWYPLSILCPDLFRSRYEFGVRFCAGHMTRYGMDYSGASNLKELNKILKEKIMLRRLKEDVLKDLPPKTRTVIPFTLGPKARADYNEAVRHFLLWLKKVNSTAALRAAKAEAVVRVGYLKRLAAYHKLPLVVDWIKDFLEDGDQKMIVFGFHHKVLDGIEDRFKNISLKIDGTVPSKNRQIVMDVFNTDKRKRLLIGQITAAGVGLNCRSSSNVAFSELDWVPGNHIQAEDRVHGIKRGTGAPVNCYYLVAKDTIEEKLCATLTSKSDILTATLDGKEVGTFKIIEQLVESLKEYGRKNLGINLKGKKK